MYEPSDQERAELPEITRQYLADLEAEVKLLREVRTLLHDATIVLRRGMCTAREGTFVEANRLIGQVAEVLTGNQ